MRVLSISIMIFICTTAAAAGAQETVAANQTQGWTRDAVELFSSMPVQDGGRVKPLETVANVKLLKFNGRRSCKTPAGESLTPMKWMMDVMFRPESAKTYKMFRVDNSDVLAVLGVKFEKKRDAYSYNDLNPARNRLFELAEKYSRMDPAHRRLVESQILNLAENINEFEGVVGYFDFARARFSTSAGAMLRSLLGTDAEVGYTEALKSAAAIVQEYMELRSRQEKTAELDALGTFMGQLRKAAGNADAFALIPPPPGSSDAEWKTPGDLLDGVVAGAPVSKEQFDLLAALESLPATVGDQAAFTATVRQLNSSLTNMARARNEYGRLPLEKTYHRINLFYYSLVCFIFSFLLVAITWLAPRSKNLARVAMASVAVSVALLIAGIVLRCAIRGRPPVTTLYETILFVTAVAVVLSLVMERVNRQRVGLAMSAILGMCGVFLANKYEVREGSDTMPSMIAVLDTNFWLATHVTTITVGYAAGLVAGAMSHIYIVGRLFQSRKRGAAEAGTDFYRRLSRMVYGMLCFSLLFGVLGTVLGGIWANESWGRFWGWDPKENGALMIVLWQLAILHARRGGIIGDTGVNIASVAGAAIIAFSWFGVNLLGVGLHSYGFTGGAYASLLAFYILEAVFVMLGIFLYMRLRTLRAES